MTWVNPNVPVSAWFPLSAVSSIFSNDDSGVDFRYRVSDADGVRLSNETWRAPRAYTSQLSGVP